MMSSRIDEFLDARPGLRPVGITAAGCDYDRPPARPATVLVPADAEAIVSAASEPLGGRPSDERRDEADQQVEFAFDASAHRSTHKRSMWRGGAGGTSAGAWALSIVAHLAIVGGALLAVQWIREHQAPLPARSADAASDGSAADQRAATAWWAYVTAPPAPSAAGAGAEDMNEPAPAEVSPPPPVRVDPGAEQAEARIAPVESAVQAAVPHFRGGTAAGAPTRLPTPIRQ